MTSSSHVYGSQWRRARLAYLQTSPLCVMCQQRGRIELATVVDHKTPHKLGQALEAGDPAQIAAARRLFWDRGNWQPLCKTCHDGAKQSQDRTGRIRGADADGLPIDPAHHWNR